MNKPMQEEQDQEVDETGAGEPKAGREPSPLPPKWMGMVQSRKVWAAVIGVAMTLALWWLGEIEGTRAIEALTWMLGIFIGSVAFEDGMARLFSTLAHAIASQDQSDAAATRSAVGAKKGKAW